MPESSSHGQLRWIGLRPARRAAVQVVEQATAVVAQGLVGDRFAGLPGGQGTRQVTLVAAEHLALAAARLGRQQPLDPVDLRRNLVVSGLELTALRDRRLRVGDEVVLELTGGCPPCDRMDETLGPGGQAALQDLGGMTARVVQGGVLRRGDRVEVVAMGAEDRPAGD